MMTCRLALTLLFCVLGASTLLAGAKADAALKELRGEVEAAEKLVAEMDKAKPAKARSNGWTEFKAWCDAAHAIKADYDAPWYNALADLESQNNAPPTEADIKDALSRTAGLPTLAAKVVAFDEIARPVNAQGIVEDLEVLPFIDAFRYGVGRAVLLDRTGRGEDGRAELRVLATVMGKLNATQNNLSLMVVDTLRSQLIKDGLLLPAGRPGWDAAFIREIIALMPEPSARPSVLMGGELRHMAFNVRGAYLKEGDIMATLKKDEPTRMKKAADADAEAASILGDLRRVVRAMRNLIEADRKQAIDTSTLEGMKRALAFDADLGEHAFMLWQPCLASLRRGVLNTAMELKLLELEKGPLASQRAGAEKLAAAKIGIKLTWEGDTAIVALDESHEIIAGKRAYAPEIRLKPAKR